MITAINYDDLNTITGGCICSLTPTSSLSSKTINEVVDKIASSPIIINKTIPKEMFVYASHKVTEKTAYACSNFCCNQIHTMQNPQGWILNKNTYGNCANSEK